MNKLIVKMILIKKKEIIMRYFLMGDTGGPADDFVESVYLFSVTSVADLKMQILAELEDYYFPMVEKGVFQFIEIDTLEQGERHMDFFHKELNDAGDTDCWRHSVDLPLLISEKKDILTEKDFTLNIEEIKCTQEKE